ncbi:polyprotein [Phytophthora megakarya]|uniref:Polyprotein n=1 Tax=Phytophthora megakarya TaxID=4795 RepID=A0A225X0K6_9STRA|nr:polyprotein [Phytophthora megakarya]
MEKARSLLYYNDVTTRWLAKAISTAKYLINRTSNSTRPTTTPYESSFKVKPRLDHLRVFGPIGYAHLDKSKRTKLEAKSFKCMFLGYAEDSKGYRVYDLESNNVKVSRSAKQDECEVNSIYHTTTTENSKIIFVTKNVEGSALPERME